MQVVCMYMKIFLIFVCDETILAFNILFQDIKIDVVAVLNDATGTLMAGSYLDKQCGIGLIMGRYFM